VLVFQDGDGSGEDMAGDFGCLRTDNITPVLVDTNDGDVFNATYFSSSIIQRVVSSSWSKSSQCSHHPSLRLLWGEP
jgi:hypothetical protein